VQAASAAAVLVGVAIVGLQAVRDCKTSFSSFLPLSHTISPPATTPFAVTSLEMHLLSHAVAVKTARKLTLDFFATCVVSLGGRASFGWQQTPSPHHLDAQFYCKEMIQEKLMKA
jgi:hypothetical protein